MTFVGEQGLDWGGVSREWFEVLAKELFDPNYSQLFHRLTDNPQGLVSGLTFLSFFFLLHYFIEFS